jgi:hypothetical protein
MGRAGYGTAMTAHKIHNCSKIKGEQHQSTLNKDNALMAIQQLSNHRAKENLMIGCVFQ